MAISTCCGAETDMDEMGICPECLEHCDWEEEEEEEEPTQEERQLDADTERAIEEEQINNQNK
jgi:hypothetical protein